MQFCPQFHNIFGSLTALRWLRLNLSHFSFVNKFLAKSCEYWTLSPALVTIGYLNTKHFLAWMFVLKFWSWKQVHIYMSFWRSMVTAISSFPEASDSDSFRPLRQSWFCVLWFGSRVLDVLLRVLGIVKKVKTGKLENMKLFLILRDHSWPRSIETNTMVYIHAESQPGRLLISTSPFVSNHIEITGYVAWLIFRNVPDDSSFLIILSITLFIYHHLQLLLISRHARKQHCSKLRPNSAWISYFSLLVSGKPFIALLSCVNLDNKGWDH